MEVLNEKLQYLEKEFRFNVQNLKNDYIYNENEFNEKLNKIINILNENKNRNNQDKYNVFELGYKNLKETMEYIDNLNLPFNFNQDFSYNFPSLNTDIINLNYSPNEFNNLNQSNVNLISELIDPNYNKKEFVLNYVEKILNDNLKEIDDLYISKDKYFEIFESDNDENLHIYNLKLDHFILYDFSQDYMNETNQKLDNLKNQIKNYLNNLTIENLENINDRIETQELKETINNVPLFLLMNEFDEKGLIFY